MFLYFNSFSLFESWLNVLPLRGVSHPASVNVHLEAQNSALLRWGKIVVSSVSFVRSRCSLISSSFLLFSFLVAAANLMKAPEDYRALIYSFHCPWRRYLWNHNEAMKVEVDPHRHRLAQSANSLSWFPLKEALSPTSNSAPRIQTIANQREANLSSPGTAENKKSSHAHVNSAELNTCSSSTTPEPNPKKIKRSRKTKQNKNSCRKSPKWAFSRFYRRMISRQ